MTSAAVLLRDVARRLPRTPAGRRSTGPGLARLTALLPALLLPVLLSGCGDQSSSSGAGNIPAGTIAPNHHWPPCVPLVGCVPPRLVGLIVGWCC